MMNAKIPPALNKSPLNLQTQAGLSSNACTLKPKLLGRRGELVDKTHVHIKYAHKYGKYG
eukprot:scaffold369405_cov17-Prasinocladus_malaysianus.AAC.1